MRAVPLGHGFKKKPLATVSADVIDGINRSIKQIREASDEMSSAKMILSNLYFLGLLGDISANILDFTKENNLIMLSDTNEMLKKIINKDDAPFIYERVGIRLKNFLIDEFQDTSKMQWENLEPLVANSLAEGNDNLIIGDVKQSIYRFRNSDPTILKDDIYRTFGRQITDIGTSLKENTNWRSASNIVRWNNTLFTLKPRACAHRMGGKRRGQRLHRRSARPHDCRHTRRPFERLPATRHSHTREQKSRRAISHSPHPRRRKRTA